MVRPKAHGQAGGPYSAGGRSERDSDSTGREERRDHEVWAKALRKEIEGSVRKQWRSGLWLAGAGTEACGPERAGDRLLTMRT